VDADYAKIFPKEPEEEVLEMGTDGTFAFS
jgi:hypothetical protein